MLMRPVDRLTNWLFPAVRPCNRCGVRYTVTDSTAGQWSRTFCTMECAVLAQEEQVM